MVSLRSKNEENIERELKENLLNAFISTFASRNFSSSHLNFDIHTDQYPIIQLYFNTKIHYDFQHSLLGFLSHHESLNFYSCHFLHLLISELMDVLIYVFDELPDRKGKLVIIFIFA